MSSPLKKQNSLNNKRKSLNPIETVSNELNIVYQQKVQIQKIFQSNFPQTYTYQANSSPSQETIESYTQQVCNNIPQPQSYNEHQNLSSLMQRLTNQQYAIMESNKTFILQSKKEKQQNKQQQQIQKQQQQVSSPLKQTKQSKRKNTNTNSITPKSLSCISSNDNSNENTESLDYQNAKKINIQVKKPSQKQSYDSMDTMASLGKYSPLSTCSQRTLAVDDSCLSSPIKNDQYDSIFDDLNDFYLDMPMKKKKSCFEDHEITEKFLNFPDTIEDFDNNNLNEVY